ncbi:hypothetical protein D3C72_1605060 [compost metagenome]
MQPVFQLCEIPFDKAYRQFGIALACQAQHHRQIDRRQRAEDADLHLARGGIAALVHFKCRCCPEDVARFRQLAYAEAGQGHPCADITGEQGFLEQRLQFADGNGDGGLRDVQQPRSRRGAAGFGRRGEVAQQPQGDAHQKIL